MRHIRRLIGAYIVSFAAAAAFVLGGTGTAFAKAPDVMPVAEVDAGMTGYGLTVFSGTAIDTFGVEVIGVLRQYGVQNSAIIARLSGGPLEQTGVAQGMSGSPVFIDGKLIGAVAWTATFTKEPLAGITPYEYMDEVRTRPMSAPDATRFTSAPLDPIDLWKPPMDAHAPDWWSTPVDDIDWSLGPRLPDTWSSDPALAPYAGIEMVPIKTPVSVSGVDPRAVGALQELLEPFNMRVVQGGTMAAGALSNTELAPGSSLGVVLATGDLSVTATGTVTWRDGDSVVGFGHPMFFKGHIDFPMSTAHVHFVWPSQYISYKIASGGEIVGSIRQDRRFGVAGLLGEKPDMLPVEVNIAGGRGPHTIRYEVVRDRDMTPNIVSFGLMGAFYDLEKLGGPAAIEMTTRIEIEGHEPIVRKNFYTDDGGLMRATQAATRPLAFLSRNPFSPVRIKSVRFDLDFTEEIDAAFVTGIEIPRRVVRPGEPIIVRTLFQSYLGDEWAESTSLTIPEDTPDGMYLLRVGGGAEAEQWTVNRMPGRFIPENVPHLIELLNYEERNDRLHLEVVNQSLGMTVENRVLPDLPHTTFEMMRHAVPSGRVGPVFGAPIVEDSVPVETYVIGAREIPVAVYKHARPR